jgi:hypothetical protein
LAGVNGWLMVVMYWIAAPIATGAVIATTFRRWS